MFHILIWGIRYLLRFIFFLAVVKSWVLLWAKPGNGNFATIFAPKPITSFSNLLRQNTVGIKKNQLLCGQNYPSSTMCLSRISGDIATDDVTSGTKSTTTEYAYTVGSQRVNGIEEPQMMIDGSFPRQLKSYVDFAITCPGNGDLWITPQIGLQNIAPSTRMVPGSFGSACSPRIFRGQR